MLPLLSGVMLFASVAKRTPDLTYQTLPLDPHQSSLAGKRPALLMPLHVTSLLHRVGRWENPWQISDPSSKEGCECGYVSFLASWIV